jgi:hypothetical protein
MHMASNVYREASNYYINLALNAILTQAEQG